MCQRRQSTWGLGTAKLRLDHGTGVIMLLISAAGPQQDPPTDIGCSLGLDSI